VFLLLKGGGDLESESSLRFLGARDGERDFVEYRRFLKAGLTEERFLGAGLTEELFLRAARLGGGDRDRLAVRRGVGERETLMMLEDLPLRRGGLRRRSSSCGLSRRCD